jgi:hypothetical protein
VFSAAIPSKVREDNAVIVQSGPLILYLFFSHTSCILLPER